VTDLFNSIRKTIMCLNILPNVTEILYCFKFFFVNRKFGLNCVKLRAFTSEEGFCFVEQRNLSYKLHGAESSLGS
jgi:hypothetical protein